jgi:hypothetical protein
MPEQRPRQRLVPPRPQEREDGLGSGDLEAERWAKGLHQTKRSVRLAVLGNGLLLVLLLGLPWARGYRRALETRAAYAELAACLYGGKARAEPGLAPDPSEPEHLAAQLVRAQKGWPERCDALLTALAPAPAFFLLPSVKEAEEQVRAAVDLVKRELPALSRQRALSAMPRRPLRAMEVLRASIAAQVKQIAFMDSAVQSAVQLERAHALPATGHFPIYTAPDAALSLWGDDQSLRATALDKTGLSYLEVEPGKPFRRARLSRSRSLRGLVRHADTQTLVWATPEARCEERAAGCYGKTTGLAQVMGPLLELPVPLQLAGHIAGRVDRSLLVEDGRVLMVVETESRRASVREFMLGSSSTAAEALPPIAPFKSWSAEAQSLLVLAAQGAPVVLGTELSGHTAKLLRVRASESSELATFAAQESAWVTGCARGEQVRFAFGSAALVQAGALRLTANGQEQAHVWRALSSRAAGAVHAHDPERDAVRVLCTASAALVFVLDQEHALQALRCDDGAEHCELRLIAQHVQSYSVVATADGALLAYAGDVERPQIRARALTGEPLVVGPEQIPGACWDSAQGLCGKPVLSRLGRRILLTAHEGADLVGLESADEGRTWTTPPVL